MGRMYSAVFQAVAVTAAQDLFSILATATVKAKIHAIHIGQSSDFGDAQDENLRIRIQRGMTTVGSGGGPVTAVDLQLCGTAGVCTVRINDTTAASGGTIVQVHEECFNVRAGWIYMPTPEMRPVVDVSTRIAVNLVAAPADSLTMSGTIYFEEF